MNSSADFNDVFEQYKDVCPANQLSSLKMLVKVTRGDEEKILQKIEEWWHLDNDEKSPLPEEEAKDAALFEIETTTTSKAPDTHPQQPKHGNEEGTPTTAYAQESCQLFIPNAPQPIRQNVSSHVHPCQYHKCPLVSTSSLMYQGQSRSEVAGCDVGLKGRCEGNGYMSCDKCDWDVCRVCFELGQQQQQQQPEPTPLRSKKTTQTLPNGKIIITTDQTMSDGSVKRTTETKTSIHDVCINTELVRQAPTASSSTKATSKLHALVVGLVSRPELNGKSVEVIRFDPSNERYDISTGNADSSLLALKPTNLIFPVGTRVQINGLMSATSAQFNGKSGVVSQPFSKEEGRYTVQLDESKDTSLGLKPVNCVVVLEPSMDKNVNTHRGNQRPTEQTRMYSPSGNHLHGSDLQITKLYLAGNRVKVTHCGISFAIPTGYKGLNPVGSCFFIINPTTVSQGLTPPPVVGAMVTGMSGINEEQARQLLTLPIPYRANLFYQPVAAPSKQGNRLFQRYKAPSLTGIMHAAAATLLGPKLNGISIVVTGKNKEAVFQFVDEFCSLCELSYPHDANRRKLADRLLRGKHIIRMENNGVYAKHYNDQNLYLWSSGYYSYQQNAEWNTSYAAGASSNGSQGRWNIVVGHALDFLILVPSNGLTESHPFVWHQKKLYIDGKEAYIQGNINGGGHVSAYGHPSKPGRGLANHGRGGGRGRGYGGGRGRGRGSGRGNGRTEHEPLNEDAVEILEDYPSGENEQIEECEAEGHEEGDYGDDGFSAEEEFVGGDFEQAYAGENEQVEECEAQEDYEGGNCEEDGFSAEEEFVGGDFAGENEQVEECEAQEGDEGIYYGEDGFSAEEEFAEGDFEQAYADTVFGGETFSGVDLSGADWGSAFGGDGGGGFDWGAAFGGGEGGGFDWGAAFGGGEGGGFDCGSDY